MKMESARDGHAQHDAFRHTVDFFAGAEDFPAQYIDLLMTRLAIQHGDAILEVGCGAGGLAAALSDRGLTVDALDRSTAMIAFARSAHPSHDRVNWINCAAEEWTIPDGRYAAVLSFEAFHLLEDPPSFIRRVERSSRDRSIALGVGWRLAEWEERFATVIVEIFNEFGVPFDDWGYWLCPDLPKWLGGRWTLVSSDEVVRHTRTGLDQAVGFIKSIERASHLPRDSADAFEQCVRSRLASGFGADGRFGGVTRYGLHAATFVR